jgi:hypothetical protein
MAVEKKLEMLGKQPALCDSAAKWSEPAIEIRRPHWRLPRWHAAKRLMRRRAIMTGCLQPVMGSGPRFCLVQAAHARLGNSLYRIFTNP